MKPRVIIENVVAMARLGQKIDLMRAAASLPWESYWKGDFLGLIIKIERPRSCLLLFENGKVVCTGARSEADAREAVKKCAGKLRRAGLLQGGNPEVKVQNIVAAVSLDGAMIGLESLVAADRPELEVMYEPEQFPGAICHMKSPRVAVLAFLSGKLVCTGAKREEDVYRAVEKFMRILEESGALIRNLREAGGQDRRGGWRLLSFRG